MEALIAVLAPHLISLVSGLVGLGVTALTIKLRQLLQAKLGRELGAAAAGRVNDIVQTVVLELDQTVVGAARKAAEDGKITAEEAGRIKGLAVERSKSLLGKIGEKEIMRALSMGEQAFGEYLRAKVEAHVSAKKQALPPFFMSPEMAKKMSAPQP